MISNVIEPKCIQPTLVCDHPLVLSSLAHANADEMTANRFELFIGGKEYVNAYQELTDATEQRRRFEVQRKERLHGDQEVPEADEFYCGVLEYGMPPTCGWGLGVDRFCMLLLGATRIRDVLSFPALKTEI